MDKIQLYETIVKYEGDCFTEKDPPCQFCPFKDDCIFNMIARAKFISKETRLEWALNELAKEFLIDDID
jgi:hypothetical protein